MASTDGAEKRIAFLLGFATAGHRGERVRPRYSPPSLSGTKNEVLSYRLPIVYTEKNGYGVIDTRSSLTTNRHIQAARGAMERNGYQATGEQFAVSGRRYDFYAPKETAPGA